MTKFEFKKRYGQNFLQNEFIANKIVDSISPSKDDLIIEIGPGAGAITKRLKKYNSYLIAYEIDEDTKKYLLPLEDAKTKIIYKDFLETDLKQDISSIKYDNIFIIGNLPYYITTPIIEKVIDSQIMPQSLTIMVQKEVGERFMASPHTKEYGYMTVLLNYWFNIEKITDVNKTEFYPMPKVDSMVIKLSKKEAEKIDYKKFKSILMSSFQFKRKTIYNNLKTYNKEKLECILQKHNATLSSRAEELDLETFIDLSKNLSWQLNHVYYIIKSTFCKDTIFNYVLFHMNNVNFSVVLESRCQNFVLKDT